MPLKKLSNQSPTPTPLICAPGYPEEKKKHFNPNWPLFSPVVSLAPLEPAVSGFGWVWPLSVTVQWSAGSERDHLVAEIAPFVPGIVAVVSAFQLAPEVVGL